MREAGGVLLCVWIFSVKLGATALRPWVDVHRPFYALCFIQWENTLCQSAQHPGNTTGFSLSSFVAILFLPGLWFHDLFSIGLGYLQAISNILSSQDRQDGFFCVPQIVCYAAPQNSEITYFFLYQFYYRGCLNSLGLWSDFSGRANINIYSSACEFLFLILCYFSQECCKSRWGFSSVP